ncbi:Rpn family recombination-promoting nuclease/putative transposase [Paenibacillus sp. p-8]|uniref:Rpn family recombination-promoting nuclease/putative transposase n=1 Tax=Paenibacillus jiagnxiensis TaxID=3228926 RepID=UPI0038D3CBD2
MTTLEFLSQDEEARRLYEARQKYLHDEASMIEGARAEGVTVGETKAKLEMAKNLLSKGIDIKVIAEASGLPEETIRKLVQ